MGINKKDNHGLLILILSIGFVLAGFATYEKMFPTRFHPKIYQCWIEPHLGIEPELRNIKEESKSEWTRAVDREVELVILSQESQRERDNDRERD